MLDRILSSLTPKQAAIVGVASVFVTVIGGLLIALLFMRYGQPHQAVEGE